MKYRIEERYKNENTNNDNPRHNGGNHTLDVDSRRTSSKSGGNAGQPKYHRDSYWFALSPRSLSVSLKAEGIAG